jgi:hypothetical protein
VDTVVEGLVADLGGAVEDNAWLLLAGVHDRVVRDVPDTGLTGWAVRGLFCIAFGDELLHSLDVLFGQGGVTAQAASKVLQSLGSHG